MLLRKRAEERPRFEDFFEENSVCVGFINIRSYKKHRLDFLQDLDFEKCALIGLCETWLEKH